MTLKEAWQKHTDATLVHDTWPEFHDGVYISREYPSANEFELRERATGFIWDSFADGDEDVWELKS